uniref:Uncharacterized protein n=1 Tax=Arundo donax TaxID=35708 RepID=A0A0A8YN01_ARUDO
MASSVARLALYIFTARAYLFYSYLHVVLLLKIIDLFHS